MAEEKSSFRLLIIPSAEKGIESLSSTESWMTSLEVVNLREDKILYSYAGASIEDWLLLVFFFPTSLTFILANFSSLSSTVLNSAEWFIIAPQQ